MLSIGWPGQGLRATKGETQMWRFALAAGDAVRCSKACLLEKGVEEDAEISQLIRAWDKDQVVFLVRDGC